MPRACSAAALHCIARSRPDRTRLDRSRNNSQRGRSDARAPLSICHREAAAATSAIADPTRVAVFTAIPLRFLVAVRDVVDRPDRILARLPGQVALAVETSEPMSL